MRCLLTDDWTVPSAAGLTLQDCSETFMGCRCDVRRCALTVKMAEAAEAPQHRFFCHCCKCETNPKLPVSHVWRVFFFLYSTRCSVNHPGAHGKREGGIWDSFFFGEAIFSLLNVQTERIDLLTAGSWIILTGIACSATACLLWWLFVCVKRAHRSYMRKERGEREGVKSGDSRCHI